MKQIKQQNVVLESVADSIDFSSLPQIWQSLDLTQFSASKVLWEYQSEGLKKALKILNLYFNRLESTSKEGLFDVLSSNGLLDEYDYDLSKLDKGVSRILGKYYPQINRVVSYANFVNRMSFWMATGSGKTLMIIKMMEILKSLMDYEELPQKDILFLTFRNDLLEQFKEQVEAYNRNYHNPIKINLKEIKDLASYKRVKDVSHKNVLTVFYYRSDNIRDKQSEKVLDYNRYENGGNWYVFLDEAHKGDKDDSKRQQAYSVFSRNGFLFNFSATFTDPRDIAHTVYKFDLSEFIKKQYGKHLVVLKQEFTAFKRKNEDFSDEEKELIVLKSLLLLTYTSIQKDAIAKAGHPDWYHKPLLLTLVNSVDTDQSDLFIFFKMLDKIASGSLPEFKLELAKSDLIKEITAEDTLNSFENSKVMFDAQCFKKIGFAELLREVFNSDEFGKIEVSTRANNRQELAFRLKTSTNPCPFAIIKIGDITKWLKTKLTEYETIMGFSQDSHFDMIDAPESDVKILMGSRAFYEGWDSNRPNIINFINIGMNSDTRKFILQSLGRGVRISPFPPYHNRLLKLTNNDLVSFNEYRQIEVPASAVETLFVFGTNQNALNTVLEALTSVDAKKVFEEEVIPVEVNPSVKNDKKVLLIPTYKESASNSLTKKGQIRFSISQSDFDLLTNYVNSISSDNVLMFLHNARPTQIQWIRESITEKNKFFSPNGNKIGNINALMAKLKRHYDLNDYDVKSVKPMENEISHYEAIRSQDHDLRESVAKKVHDILKQPKVNIGQAELFRKVAQGLMTEGDFMKALTAIQDNKNESELEANGVKIWMPYMEQHYYVPLLVSETDKLQHIVSVSSEKDFLLEVQKSSDLLSAKYDWWAFSKIDEHLDDVFIPYYDPETNGWQKFKPDFIFWLVKGNSYVIYFVDPKGFTQSGYQHKVDGFDGLFISKDTPKVFEYAGYKVTVKLALYTKNADLIGKRYRPIWKDNVDF